MASNETTSETDLDQALTISHDVEAHMRAAFALIEVSGAANVFAAKGFLARAIEMHDEMHNLVDRVSG